MKPSKFHQELRSMGCRTIGDYEMLAGIDQDHKSRFDFWIKFKNHNPDVVIETGCKTLIAKIKYRIRAKKLCLVNAEKKYG